jgi:hypothetical protein
MFERLVIAAELAGSYDRSEHAAYWAVLRAADRMRVSIPGISREALAGAIAGEVPGGFHVAPEVMARIYAAIPELGRRELRH